MNKKIYEYLFYKVRGASKEEIIKQANLSEAEYESLESSQADMIKEIRQDRDKAADIGPEFVKLTRYIYASRSPQQEGVSRPNAIMEMEGESIALPAVDKIEVPEISLYDAIRNRRSTRQYSEVPLSIEELSFLLWAGFWVKELKSNERVEFTLRNVPSAGARHPLECYLMINRVQGIEPGLYHYQPLRHELVRLERGEDIGQEVCEAALGQEMVAKSAVTFIVSAIPQRTAWRYVQRAYRYLYLDAGHVGQNISLACEAIGAGACMIGAYQDEDMNELIGANGEDEFVIYAFSVGKKAN